MTLKEAIDSGKRFKRRDWVSYVPQDIENLNIFDAQATDWEVEASAPSEEEPK